MPSFLTPANELKRTPFVYIASIDPTIDWERSTCTQDEYRADPEAHRSHLVHTEEPIKIWVQLPSEDDQLIALARAGWELDDQGVQFRTSDLPPVMSGVLALSGAFKQLAKLCIVQIENLDGCPETIRKTYLHDTKVLLDEVCALLTDAVLYEVGAFLYRKIEGGIDDAKKKPFAPSSGGTMPKSSTPTPTTAASASEMTTSPDGGAAKAPPNPTNTPASDSSTTSEARSATGAPLP